MCSKIHISFPRNNLSKTPTKRPTDLGEHEKKKIPRALAVSEPDIVLIDDLQRNPSLYQCYDVLWRMRVSHRPLPNPGCNSTTPILDRDVLGGLNQIYFDTSARSW